MKGIGPLGRELCKIFRGQVRRKIIKTLKETSTWTRHACVQQQKFCPSVADSLNGWQPVQTGSDEEYVHHNIMAEVVLILKWPSRPTSAWWKRLCSSDAWKGWRKARMRLSKTSWSGICGPNRDLLVLKWWSYQHIWLQPALTMELSPYWLFYAKWDALQGVLPNPMCNSKRPKKSGKLKSRLVRSRNTGENLWEREITVLRRKHVEGEGQTYEPDTFWPQFLWVTGVFLNLKLCAFWRSAAHSVHDNFLTIHCGPVKVLILKTIGNRTGDCAWSCSRWQTQPEKICKSQRTNQCHSLRMLYWFVLCNLQIFSGCVCHLEQLHAQSPVLFPIVFSINLSPFFDICSVLAVLSPRLLGYVLLYLGRCAVATVAVCGFGSWSLVFHCGLPHEISPLLPTPSQTEVSSTMGESIRPLSWSFHNLTLSTNKHVVQICRSSLSAAVETVQVSVELSQWPPVSTALKDRSVVPLSQRLSLCPSPLPRIQQRCLCRSRTMGESISTIQLSPRISTSYKFAASPYRLPPMALQTVQVSVEPRVSTALKERSVVPLSQRLSLPVSATTFPTALSL